MVPSPDLVSIAGIAGFDFVIVDLEHGALSFSDVCPLVNAALASGVRPIIRVPELNSAMIGKALDSGADAIIVPGVEKREHAAAAVAAAKFAPLGARGACPRVRGSAYGVRPRGEFYSRDNDERAIITLVESRKGIENVRQIVGVEGLDALFLGYSDLSHSLGHVNDPGHPVVRACLDGAIREAKAANVLLGVSCLSEAEAQDRLRSGVSFVTFSGIETLALNGCRDAVRRLRGG